jgi:hypothetical protein
MMMPMAHVMMVMPGARARDGGRQGQRDGDYCGSFEKR